MRDWTAQEIKDMADRLRRARITAGFGRATEAVRKFGWNYSRYMNYENGERPIPPKQAMLFANAYGVSVDYIYFGIGDKLNQKKGIFGLVYHVVRRIPLIALDNISELQRIASGLEPMLTFTLPIADDEELPKNCIFICVADKSMSNPAEPVSFEPGDNVLIDLDAAPKPSEFVLALVPGERTALFRRYREVDLTSERALIIDLLPLNHNFRKIRIEDGVSGTILGVCRRIHRIVNL